MISDNVMYNYLNTSIYKNQYANSLNKNDLSEQYIKISFTNGKNTTNPSFIINNNKYVTRHLYILNKNHNIQGIEYDGELIIEHTPITNGEKSYLCILLQTNPNIKETAIDKIINNSFKDHLELNINDLLLSINKQEECIGNPAQNVYILKQPIQINSRFDNFIVNSPILFPKYKKEDYHTIRLSSYSKDNAIESFVEGATNKYMECQLMDASKDTSPTITIPINGKTTQTASETNLVNTSSNFIVFFVFLAVSLTIIPICYSSFVVKTINTTCIGACSKRIRSISTDLSIILLSVIIIILLLTSQDIMVQTAGIFFTIFLGIAILEIFVLRNILPDFGIQDNSEYVAKQVWYDFGDVFFSKPLFYLIDYGNYGRNFFTIVTTLFAFVALQVLILYTVGNSMDSIRSFLFSSESVNYWFVQFLFIFIALYTFDIYTDKTKNFTA